MLIDAEIMTENRNPRWRPSAILDFQKSDFWALGPLRLPIFHLAVKFGAQMLIDAEIMAQNRNPRWRILAAVRHLGFSKIWFLSTGTLWATDFPSLYQIWHKNVDRRQNYGPNSKSKLAAVRHLDFRKSDFWALGGTPWAADFPSRCKIWCKNVDRRRNYGPKSKSKMAAVGHLGFVTLSYRTAHIHTYIHRQKKLIW